MKMFCSVGYSVFAVTQGDPDAPLALPRTEADIIAATLPEPTSGGTMAHFTKETLAEPQRAGNLMEDEDYGLQAALQASLTDQNIPCGPSSSTGTTGVQSSRYQLEARAPHLAEPSDLDEPGHINIDPVAASLGRNRVLLQQMKEQQEQAQREMWSEMDMSSEESAAVEERRQRRRRQEEEEEADLQRAIEESQALAALAEKQRIRRSEDHHDEITGTSSTIHDDEEAELQAALKASLEHFSPPSATLNAPDDVASANSDTDSIIEENEDAVAPIVSLDEIRRRRLARFGS